MAAGAPEDGRSLGNADQVVVGDDAGVGVERGTDPERDQVAPLLRVHEQHPLARPKQAPVLHGGHGAQSPGGEAEPGWLEPMTRRSPGINLVRKITSWRFRARVSIQMATPTTNQAVW